MIRTKTDIKKLIETQEKKLFLERLNGKKRLPYNHLTKENLMFDYSKVSEIYHLSKKPEDEIILYKGALRGFEDTGLLSNALREGFPQHIGEVKEIIEGSSNNEIKSLFDMHSSGYNHTALLSATFNPEQAQVFAPTEKTTNKDNKTIYQIKLKANRCVLDIYNTGFCHKSKEVLILGAIFPEEISAVKMINDDEHSELIDCYFSCKIIKNFPEKNSFNREVKNPDNWKHLRQPS